MKAPEPFRLEEGDRIPDLGWVDPAGERLALDHDRYAGRPSVLFVCASASAPGVSRELAKFRDLHEKFQALGVQIFAVAPEPPAAAAELARKLDLPFPVLSDARFALGRALRLEPAERPRKGRGWCTVVADPNQRVVRLIEASSKQAIPAYTFCEKRAGAQAASVVTMQAPVLLVPSVLSPAHCARLVRLWETSPRYEGGVANRGLGRNVPVRDVKVRTDVALADLGADAQELFGVFRRRLFPEIRKAYGFRVTRAETLRLGCYEASEGGHFRPHRDDTTPYTAHRRFAMSLNLNAGEYDGGYLRFPEYGPQLYGPETGGAIVFSCSLLHEATPVTAGRRFVLLGFFYSEAEQALRERAHAQRAASAS